MLEIVHDLAPGAQLYFATALRSEANFANNIQQLQAAGCNIIVDDELYNDESPFQDGIVAKAVNTVTANGVFIFHPQAIQATKMTEPAGLGKEIFLTVDKLHRHWRPGVFIILQLA